MSAMAYVFLKQNTICVEKMECPYTLETCRRQVRGLEEHLAPLIVQGSPLLGHYCLGYWQQNWQGEYLITNNGRGMRGRTTGMLLQLRAGSKGVDCVCDAAHSGYGSDAGQGVDTQQC